MRRAFIAAIALSLCLPLFAARLPQTVQPLHYSIVFEPDLKAETFRGEETIAVRLRERTNRIVLNAVDLQIEEASVAQGRPDRSAERALPLPSGVRAPEQQEFITGGSSLRSAKQIADVSVVPVDETVTLTVPRALPAGDALIHLRFSAALNQKLRGLYVSRTPRRKYATTQFEATYARRAFPSFDEPAMKATFDISVIADAGDTAISNGKIVSDTPGPGPGKHTIRFSKTPKMSTYLVALAVGDFKCVDGKSSDGIPIRACSVPEKVELTRFAVEAAERQLAFYNRYYGVKYPFGKLDLLALPDFEAGAMENTAAITFRESAMLIDEKASSVESRQRVAGTVSHEIAHQWFGDLVTLNWWDDLWLNEGFASWAAPKPNRGWHPEWSTPVRTAQATSGALSADSLASTRPIRLRTTSTAEIETLFDAIAYSKAAALLRMVEAYIGEEPFRKGVQAYIRKYSYGNATAENFWNTVASTTGEPVDRIMTSYVDQAGSPLVSATASCSGGSTQLTLSQRRMFADRTHFSSAAQQTWVIPVTIRDLDKPSAEPIRLLLTDKEKTFTLSGCRPHLFINREGQGLYRTQHAANMLEPAAGLEKALSVAETAVLLNDSWALVRLGAEPVAQHLDLIGSLRTTRDSTLVDLIATHLSSIGTQLVPQPQQPQFRSWVASYMKPILDETGWKPVQGEPDDKRVLRLAAISGLGMVARDEQTIHHAREIVDEALKGGADTDPSILRLAIAIAARTGDTALFEEYWKRASQAKSPVEYERYFGGLAGFSDPTLVRRMIDIALSPDVRSQDTPRLLMGPMFNPESNAVAWEYLKQRWGDLEKKLSGPTLAGTVGGTGALCDAGLRKDVVEFFAAHKIPGSERGLRQALERIDACIEFKSLQSASIQSWLAAHGGSPSAQ